MIRSVFSHQVVLGLGYVGVIWSQFALVDVQSAFVVLLHLLVLPLVLTQQSQVVQLLGHVWVVRAQNLNKEPERKWIIPSMKILDLMFNLR